MLKIIIPMMMTLFINSKEVKTTIWVLMMIYNLNVQNSPSSETFYTLTMDLTSYWMVNLSMWITTIILLIKLNKMKKHYKMTMMLMFILMVTFFSWDLIMFYLFFEMTMVLIVVITMSWGYQPERIEAIMFMVVMTSMFSLPFFISIMTMPTNTNYWFLKQNPSMWEYLSFLGIFMVKMPVYFIHMWLPKLHVESPVHGSMILAAIMLKLGCYGMMRVTPLTLKPNFSMISLIMAFSLWSMIIVSMICNMQSDLKMMVAYSSIVHMMLTLIGINLEKSKSMMASMIVMIGHGMCASALFFMCNQMYKTTKSRSIIINKGILSTMPTMITMWFILCMMNAPMPPSINMISEILVFKMSMDWSTLNFITVFITMLTSSWYSIILFCIPSHGAFTKMYKNTAHTSSKSIIIVMMHIIPGIMLIVKANMMMIN